MIKALRDLMKKSNIDAVVIPTADPHLSEYIPEHYKLREALSGFTGSSGDLVVTMDNAGLWTDGRYYIQAEKELSGSGITLFKASEKDTPKIYKFLCDELLEGSVVGVDGRLFSKKSLDKLITELDKKKISVDTSFDASAVWGNRPEMPKDKLFLFDEKYTGESLAKKAQKLRAEMKKDGFTHYLTSMPECIMWLLNVRGNDVRYTPVALSYMLVSDNFIRLYIDKAKAMDVSDYLAENGVTVCDCLSVYSDLSALDEGCYLAVDFDNANYNLIKSINCAHKDRKDFIENLKCIKTNTEIENIKKAYIKENTALVKSFYEIYNSDNLTEFDVVNIIEKYRRKLPGYYSPSFETIAAFGKNAAMVHYSPTEENSGKVGNNGLLLIDTGGQYTDGTTDTTRTLVLGEITKEEKESLTLVLKGNIAIATLVFPNGKTGKDIDAIAREPLWKKGLDYKHGTGHGIGFFLGVHEGPQRISPMCNVEFRENMTLSDEPGVYIENGYGIRIENHLCVKKYNNEFLCFEVLNYCPIGTKGIDESLLDRDETQWLNGYNEKCCELLKPHLAKEEYEWLKTYTAKI